MARTPTPSKANTGVSEQQAPKTGGSPCCGAVIITSQTLFTARTYRACANCGSEV